MKFNVSAGVLVQPVVLQKLHLGVCEGTDYGRPVDISLLVQQAGHQVSQLGHSPQNGRLSLQVT